MTGLFTPVGGYNPNYLNRVISRGRETQNESPRREAVTSALATAVYYNDHTGNMVKIKDFHIILDNNKTVYSAGEYVSGHVVVELRGDMKMRGIRVYMRGLAKVRCSFSLAHLQLTVLQCAHCCYYQYH